MTNFVVIKGAVSSLRTGHVFSDIGDVSHCKLSIGVCKHPEYIIVWTPDKLSDTICPLQHLGKFDAKLNAGFITINKLQMATRLVTDRAPEGQIKPAAIDVKKECDDEQWLVEADKDWSTMVSSMDGTLWFMYDSNHYNVHPFLNSNITMHQTLDPLNKKLQYLYNMIRDLTHNDFVSTWKELCRLAEWSLRISKQLLYIEPKLGIRALLNKVDITAKWYGSALIISQCHS